MCYSSDAETDVLTEFVLALLRIDGSVEAVKRNSMQELEDFLKESVYIMDWGS